MYHYKNNSDDIQYVQCVMLKIYSLSSAGGVQFKEWPLKVLTSVVLVS